MKYTLWLIMVFSTWMLISCGDENPHTPIAVTPTAEQLQVQFMHLERDLFAADFKNSDRVSQDLYQKYGDFWCAFVESDLQMAACTSDSVQSLMYRFVVHSDILETNKAISTVFSESDFAEFEEQLNDAFRKWSSLYPDQKVPSVVYYQSGFTNNVHPINGYLGIALDGYLGPEHPLTKKLSVEIIPQYKKEDMRKDYIVSDAVKGWVAHSHRHLYQSKDLLHELMFYGKLMHMTRSLLPEVPDTLLLNWSTAELEWAEQNEWNTWKELAREEQLFNKKASEIAKWFAQGPFTGAKGLPQESSPQLGIWIGWRMVSQYMAAHPEVTLVQLMAEQDDRKLLAAYQPKRK